MYTDTRPWGSTYVAPIPNLINDQPDFEINNTLLTMEHEHNCAQHKYANNRKRLHFGNDTRTIFTDQMEFTLDALLK